MKNGYNNLIQVSEYFRDEEVCRKHLEKQRWNGHIKCVFCNHDKVYITKKIGYKCAKCKKRFSVTTGTYFENTKISLRKWFIAMYLITAHKKGISSLQLSRDISVTQKTAWFMLHRIREMLKDKNFITLKGTVEIDETYVGGKNRNRHKNKKVQGTGMQDKIPVFGMIERKGEVRTVVIDKADGKTLVPIILENIKTEARLITDEFGGYYYLNLYYRHEVIKHISKIYVDGDIHTNTIEGFWSLLKRGIIGIYHYVSKKHLNKYCSEFTYRYNTRDISEQLRFDKSISQCRGRLKYKQLIAN